MSERVELWATAGKLATEGKPAALATVARQRGSLPMARDAKLLVTSDGHRMGTVGGGCVEADVIRQAVATIESGTPTFVKHSLNADLAGDLGLSCGGTVHIFVEPVVPSVNMAALCDAVSEGIRDRQDVMVLTGLSWSPEPTKTAWVGDDAYSVGEPRDRFEGPVDTATLVDDERQLFVERIRRLPRVIIFGAGHVGAAIAHVAACAGFYVVVIDDREEFANEKNIPDAHEIIVADFNTVFDRLRFDEDDCVLATTRGHGYDAQIVERAAPSPAGYVGMLGSRRKRAVIWKALAKAGVPREALERVKSPIGLEVGAETPGEIAVAVVAELIQRSRLRS